MTREALHSHLSSVVVCLDGIVSLEERFLV
jgi:hypothetical protein